MNNRINVNKEKKNYMFIDYSQPFALVDNFISLKLFFVVSHFTIYFY